MISGPAGYDEAVAQGDGLLNHDLDPNDRGPQDACGVFGVWAPHEEVAKLTYFGLYALLAPCTLAPLAPWLRPS
jgi:hypothetical protein